LPQKLFRNYWWR